MVGVDLGDEESEKVTRHLNHYQASIQLFL